MAVHEVRFEVMERERRERFRALNLQLLNERVLNTLQASWKRHFPPYNQRNVLRQNPDLSAKL